MSAWPRFMSPLPEMDDDMEHDGLLLSDRLPAPLPCPRCSAGAPASKRSGGQFGGWSTGCACGLTADAPLASTLGLSIVFWNDAVRADRVRS